MALSKKKRFEILKRDSFTCAYCGRTPPTVILEVDHIEPKSKGGDDSEDNLITSCFDCNRGKSGTPLNVLSENIAEKHKIMKEKEEQLSEFRKLKKRIKRRIDKDIQDIEECFQGYFPSRMFTDQFRRHSLKKFIDKLPKEEIIEALDIAANRKSRIDDVVRYFCGICWNKIRALEAPEIRKP